jgi:hypothetical protein
MSAHCLCQLLPLTFPTPAKSKFYWGREYKCISFLRVGVGKLAKKGKKQKWKAEYFKLLARLDCCQPGPNRYELLQQLNKSGEHWKPTWWHHTQYDFWDRVLLTFLPSLVSNHNPPLSTSQVAEITDMSHHTQPSSILVLGWIGQSQRIIWSISMPSLVEQQSLKFGSKMASIHWVDQHNVFISNIC